MNHRPISMLVQLLAQTDPPGPVAEPFHYIPFLRPLPVWGDGAWPWLLLPLCIGVSIVYKSIKCRKMSQVPKEAAVLTIWIVAGMATAALVLALIVEGIERASM